MGVQVQMAFKVDFVQSQLVIFCKLAYESGFANLASTAYHQGFPTRIAKPAL